ncbi:hypothetical protein FBZ98_101543 [Rhizobium sp. ERR 922]|uniref:DUF5343 domain-containing protein n=1 Tax=unclassified Rhizobium TaxID=2613769 RepID=UPI00119F6072|nr:MULTISPECIES: DUF5343 domain-containing protein [unclassified Rhizobium]TWB61208.1 hypothetical protein FBZ98_101543 [Rhizobium sp. ERR 922]TWC04134.1 hypothetical protein FBZ97_101543 [Rhizobium sp. ERR 942]
MVDFPYTQVTGKVRNFLEKIRGAGVLPKVSHAWLKTIGFTSSNDATLIGVLKFIGFIDGSSIPTQVWRDFRGGRHKAVLGDAIKKGYSELYAIYPDAHSRSNGDLTHVFSTSSTAGQQVISKTVATFKALVAEAEFSASSTSEDRGVLHSGPLHAAPSSFAPGAPQLPPSQSGPAVHIDIQIHISPESTAEQIDKIFESMAKHLYGRKED